MVTPVKFLLPLLSALGHAKVWATFHIKAVTTVVVGIQANCIRCVIEWNRCDDMWIVLLLHAACEVQHKGWYSNAGRCTLASVAL